MLRVGLERYRSSEMVRKKATQAIRHYQRGHRNAEGIHADRKSAPSQCAHQDGSGGRLGRAAAEEFRLALPQSHCPFSSRRAAGVAVRRPRHFDGARLTSSSSLAMLAAIGPCTYTEVQWNVTMRASYRHVVRPTERLPSPPTPAFRFSFWLADPHPPMTPPHVLAA